MTVRRLSAKEVLKDIRSGMDDNAIRQKYKLSAKGLEILYRLLTQAGRVPPDFKPSRRRINLVEILSDIRAGLSKSDIMRKYQLSEEMLRKVSKKLLDARGVRSVSDGTETVIEDLPEFLATQEFVRHEVDFDLPIYDADQPEIQGVVRDISELGVGAAGIEANVGDVKTLVILGDELGLFSSFQFEGHCRWRVTDQTDGTCLTAFAISKISDADSKQLGKLVRLTTLSE